MLVVADSTAWTAVGTSGFAALVVVVVTILLVRSRRSSARHLEEVQESAWRTEQMISELAQSLDRVHADSESAREERERAAREAGRLRLFGEIGSSLDLDAVAHRALEQATAATGADAALAVLYQDDPYTASFGLSAAESARELVGLPPNVSDARAVTIRYRYSDDEIANDVFRLAGGLAVPFSTDEVRIGTLAVFWRRVEPEPGEEEVERLEELAASFGPPLENARRYEEARRLADLDPVTGLQSDHYFEDRLLREIARARRYERRLALLLFRFAAGGAPGALAILRSVGVRVRSAVRSADVACHLGEGRFAVILPEVGATEAEHLHRRLQFAIGSRLGGATAHLELVAGVVELQAEDSPESFLRRADDALLAAEDAGRGAPTAETGA